MGKNKKKVKEKVEDRITSINGEKHEHSFTNFLKTKIGFSNVIYKKGIVKFAEEVDVDAHESEDPNEAPKTELELQYYGMPGNDFQIRTKFKIRILRTKFDALNTPTAIFEMPDDLVIETIQFSTEDIKYYTFIVDAKINASDMGSAMQTHLDPNVQHPDDPPIGDGD